MLALWAVPCLWILWVGVGGLFAVFVVCFGCLTALPSSFYFIHKLCRLKVIVDWALDLSPKRSTSAVAFTVSLLVKDCQNPRDPLQPASKKKGRMDCRMQHGDCYLR